MKNRDIPFINNSCISQNLCDGNRARNSEFRLYLQAIYRVSINHNLILLIASCYDVASRWNCEYETSRYFKIFPFRP